MMGREKERSMCVGGSTAGTWMEADEQNDRFREEN